MATYYVNATTGDDSDDGLSEVNAWQTISKVNSEITSDTFAAGDSIKFKRGESWTGALYIHTLDGSDGSPITFEDYGSGNLPQINYSSADHIVIIQDCSWIELKNIDVRGTGSAIDAVNLYASNTNSLSNITVDGVEVNGTPGIGIHVINGYPSGGGDVDDITITNCKVDSASLEGIYIKNYGSGISPTNGCNNVTVSKNTVIDAGYEYLQNTHHNDTDEAPSNVTFEDNECYATSSRAGDYAIVDLAITGGGIVFQRNKIHDISITGSGRIGGIWIANTLGGGDAYISYNILYDLDGTNANDGAIVAQCASSGPTLKIYNNTIYNHGGHGINIIGDDGGAVDIQNNITYDVGGTHVRDLTGSPMTCDYNLRYGTGSAGKTGANDRTGDPLFASVTDGSEDFSLQSGSDAIDNGATLGAAYDAGINPDSSWPDSVSTLDQDSYGSGWEIGAFVYGDSEVGSKLIMILT